MAEIRFLSPEDVVLIHEDTLKHEGGLSGIRSHALLESAVLMPQQQFGGVYLHDGLPTMAAAYLFHIAQNHPFNDGNKRAAALAALVFLDANGVKKLPAPKKLEKTTLLVACGEMSKDDLVAWMKGEVKAVK